jgi:hypothetical protein
VQIGNRDARLGAALDGSAPSVPDELLDVVPIGEENAVSSRVIWKRFGLWSPTNVKLKLNVLARNGQIERRFIQRGLGGVNLYFRQR